MFESAELGHVISDKEYDAEVPKLRAALLEAQSKILAKAEFPVVILVSGVEAAGKGDSVRKLYEWMDPRHLESHAMDAPNCVEAARPLMWRYWNALPRSGKTGVFFGGWYRDALYGRIYGKTTRAALEREIDEIVRFETMLTDEGALVLKLWLHLSKKQQKKRLHALEKDRRTRWQVKDSDWRNHEHYDDFRGLGEELLRRTSTHYAPWVVIEGVDAHYRNLTVGRVLLDAMNARLKARAPVSVTAAPTARVDNTALLRDLDMKKSLDKKKYDAELADCQAQLSILGRALAKKKRAVIAAFEGPDAAGKGGAIRRITQALDARHYRVIPVAAPSEEERAHPYLWRFWRHVPGHGAFALFDRSWYGRVLVERVEGLCSEADWMRAYSEINDFEAQLARSGVILAKMWLQVSKEEQLRRFKERERAKYKQYKITREDWRNRGKWDAYLQATSDMVDRTSTEIAPWTLVEANDKHYARIKIMRALIQRIEEGL